MDSIYETAETGIRCVAVFNPREVDGTVGIIDVRSMSGGESWAIPVSSLLRPISRVRAFELLQHEIDRLCLEISTLRGPRARE